MSQFKYIRHTLEQTDGDWTESRCNIKRLQKVWGLLGKILRKEGADTQVSEIFYMVMVHAVLFFGSESWVM